MRSVPEWIGATPDTPVPARVKFRVIVRANGCCQAEGCGREVGAGDRGEVDHTVAVINGGENRETNLQFLCGLCHDAKTGRDVSLKSRAYKLRMLHLGFQPTRRGRRMPHGRNSATKRKVTGEVVPR